MSEFSLGKFSPFHIFLLFLCLLLPASPLRVCYTFSLIVPQSLDIQFCFCFFPVLVLLGSLFWVFELFIAVFCGSGMLSRVWPACKPVGAVLVSLCFC